MLEETLKAKGCLRASFKLKVTALDERLEDECCYEVMKREDPDFDSMSSTERKQYFEDTPKRKDIELSYKRPLYVLDFLYEHAVCVSNHGVVHRIPYSSLNILENQT